MKTGKNAKTEKNIIIRKLNGSENWRKWKTEKIENCTKIGNKLKIGPKLKIGEYKKSELEKIRNAQKQK